MDWQGGLGAGGPKGVRRELLRFLLPSSLPSSRRETHCKSCAMPATTNYLDDSLVLAAAETNRFRRNDPAARPLGENSIPNICRFARRPGVGEAPAMRS